MAESDRSRERSLRGDRLQCRVTAAAVLQGLLVSLLGMAGAAAAFAESPSSSESGNWIAYNGTLAGDRYTSLSDVTAGNVTKLARVCVLLWKAPTRKAIGGGVISYAAGGKQYVAAAAGLNSAIWPVNGGTASVFVYALP